MLKDVNGFPGNRGIPVARHVVEGTEREKGHYVAKLILVLINVWRNAS